MKLKEVDVSVLVSDRCKNTFKVELPDKNILSNTLELIFEGDKVNTPKSKHPPTLKDLSSGYNNIIADRVTLINVDGNVASRAILDLKKGEIEIDFTSISYAKNYSVKARYATKHMQELEEKEGECQRCSEYIINDIQDSVRQLHSLTYLKEKGYSIAYNNKVCGTERKEYLYNKITELTNELKSRL